MRATIPSTRTHKAKKIVLTGGPGVGKTSIIQHLRTLNHEVREEVFTKLFGEAQSEGRFNDAFLHSQELIHDLISAQLELEAQTVSGGFLFLDRSLIDIWGFSRNMGITPLVSDQELLSQADYDYVFIIEPIPRSFYDQNAIRRQTYEESLEHHQLVVSAYTSFLSERGRNPKTCVLSVPYSEIDHLTLVADRTNFILERLKK